MEKKNKYDIGKAREMYMNYMPVSHIAKEFQVPRTTIQTHVNNKWRREREDNKNKLLAHFTNAKRNKMTKAAEFSLDLILDTLKDLKERGTPLSVVEARNVTAMLEQLDKIARLDDGKPTDITEQKAPMTTIELKKKLKEINDPFLQIEDATYEEVK